MSNRASLREWLRRAWGTLRGVRTDADLEQELRSHIELAAEDAQRPGLTPAEVARSARVRAGGVSQALDAVRDQRGLPWLDALSSDVVFGWRQILKHRAASAAAILSLGLAIGATTGAFRLVDAVLLRPLPVAEPDRLFVVATTFLDSDKRPDYQDDFDYPTYHEYARTVGDAAEMLVVGLNAPQPVMFSENEPEVVFRQFVSGAVFASLGLEASAGRLITLDDDRTAGAHPVAVLSYDFWTRRFARDPGVVGRTVRIGAQPYDIIGVGPKGFTGTEPGNVTDMFVPATMNVQALNSPGWSWFRIWLRPRAGTTPEQIRHMLQIRFQADRQNRLKDFRADTPKEQIDAFLSEQVLLRPAGSGVSGVQKTFQRPLVILAALAAVVLLIACANVANLMTARGLTRAREMALRVSIGAARWRLIQLVLIESAILAVLATVAGTIFASWSAPLVVSMLASADRPVRLVLDVDWRAIGFGLAVATVITALFGLAPAVRASSVPPIGALKGSAHPEARPRLTTMLIAGQMAFCVFLLFAAGLFIATFERLVNQPLGFSHQNVLLVQTETRAKRPPEIWAQLTNHLRQMPGVEAVTFAGWAPLTGNRWRSSVQVPGGPTEINSPYFLEVSTGYFDTMRIGMIEGRDFRAGDLPPVLDVRQQPQPGVGIVNDAFARVYFPGQSPIGRLVRVRQSQDSDVPMEIVGLVRDAVYGTIREPMRPTVYVPNGPRSNGVLMVRTAGDPIALASTLRREVGRTLPDFRVRAVEPFSAFVRQQMVRERLLATLSMFFAVIALLLAGIGLYGVLNHAVIRQRREIGIRMALGARATHLVHRVAARMLAVVSVGSLIGLAAGLAFGPVVRVLLFEVEPTDIQSLGAPILALMLAATLAAIPPAIRAVRIDPVQTLRSE